MIRHAAIGLPLLVVAGAAGVAAAQGDAPAPSAAKTPQAIYEQKCALCHAKGGTGTMMLARRLSEEEAVLADRQDLGADYVKLVVRKGIGSMPAITRVEVTDSELDAIAGYLAGDRR